MTLYRIYTENTNHEAIKEICEKHLESFTLIEGKGCYKRVWEDALIIEIIGDAKVWEDVEKVAERIRRRNGQEVVLVTRVPVEVIEVV